RRRVRRCRGGDRDTGPCRGPGARSVLAHSGLRVARQLLGQHRQRLLRRVPVLGQHVAGARLLGYREPVAVVRAGHGRGTAAVDARMDAVAGLRPRRRLALASQPPSQSLANAEKSWRPNPAVTASVRTWRATVVPGICTAVCAPKSSARPTSLFMSSVMKPGFQPLLAVLSARRPSTGSGGRTATQSPVACVSTSCSFSRSTPAFTANAVASAVATI